MPIVRLAVIVAALVANAGLWAQIPGAMNETTRTGLGGNNYVVGTVFSPSGKPISYRMRIKLVSPMRGEIISNTDDRGQFLFSGVSAGQYSIVIDGEKAFEPYTKTVEVETSRSPSPQVYTLTVRLTEARTTDSKPGVVRAEDASASKKAVALYQEALERAKADDHKGAISKLKLAVVESPKYISALNELGAQYMVVGDLARAEEPLRAALAAEPGAKAPLINLGILMFRSKRYSEAEGALTKVIAADTRSAVAHFYLGRTLMAVARTDDAIKELKETILVGGDEFKEAHRLLAILYMDKGERRRVVEELETYLRLVPNAKDADELRVVIKQNKNPRPKSF